MMIAQTDRWMDKVFLHKYPLNFVSEGYNYLNHEASIIKYQVSICIVSNINTVKINKHLEVYSIINTLLLFDSTTSCFLLYIEYCKKAPTQQQTGVNICTK